jgi:Tfp pilus assembly protein PilN
MKFWKQLWSPKKLVIVQLNYQHQSVEITATKCSLKNQEANSNTFDSIEAVIEKYGKQIPYCIHVSGTGVLTRLVEFLPGYKEQLIVNGDKDDFYFTSYNDGHHVATSFFRKHLISELIEKLNKEKIFLIQVSCGMIPMLQVLEDNDNISFDYFFQKEGGKITKCIRNEVPFDRTIIQGVFKDKQDVIIESICASLLVASENYTTGLSKEESDSHLENYRQFSLFRFFGVTVVMLVLLAVVLNYFYLNSLNSEIATLEVDLTLNNDNVSLLEKLKQEKTRKELLVSNSGVQQEEFISFFLDKIGETVPKAISLQGLEVFPLLETLKEKRKVEFKQQIIEIEGTSPESETLDDWMERMNRFSWVKSVELVNYLKAENAKASFKLVITLNP